MKWIQLIIIFSGWWNDHQIRWMRMCPVSVLLMMQQKQRLEIGGSEEWVHSEVVCNFHSYCSRHPSQRDLEITTPTFHLPSFLRHSVSHHFSSLSHKKWLSLSWQSYLKFACGFIISVMNWITLGKIMRWRFGERLSPMTSRLHPNLSFLLHLHLNSSGEPEMDIEKKSLSLLYWEFLSWLMIWCVENMKDRSSRRNPNKNNDGNFG